MHAARTRSHILTSPLLQGSAHSKSGSSAYFNAMANAWFGWCPHGDQRWNLRFLELLTAGAVPVVVADGLTLPFEQVREL